MASTLPWLGLCFALGVAPVAAQDRTTQDPAAAQPTLPKSMPNLTVPAAGDSGASRRPETRAMPRAAARHADHKHRVARRSGRLASVDRPALANVELLEPLPHPPQPPHVTVPVPAYPLENLITFYTAPPPPIVCRPTRSDRFKPDLRLVDETPTLCTADDP